MWAILGFYFHSRLPRCLSVLCITTSYPWMNPLILSDTCHVVHWLGVVVNPIWQFGKFMVFSITWVFETKCHVQLHGWFSHLECNYRSHIQGREGGGFPRGVLIGVRVRWPYKVACNRHYVPQGNHEKTHSKGSNTMNSILNAWFIDVLELSTFPSRTLWLGAPYPFT